MSAAASTFRLPDLGEGLEEAEIVTWLVSAGAVVKRDQPLVTVETDKAVVDIPSPRPGLVVAVHGAPGERLKVGSVLVEFADDDVGDDAGDDVRDEVGVGLAPPTRTHDPVLASRAKAAPSVRKLAVELGVELSTVVGSGPDGRVLADDVRRAVTAETVPSAPVVGLPAPTGAVASSSGRRPLRGVRRRTAEVVAASWASIPHIANMDEIDATGLIAARDALNRAGGENITLFALMAMAVARTVAQFPMVNANFDTSALTVEYFEHVNLGIAVATPDGLVVPVVRNADRLPLRALAAEIERLVAGARSRMLPHADLTGGTITVTNFGALGAGRFSIPIIKAPEVMIVGFGAIAERALVVDGQVVARPALPYSVTADHRVIDGDVVTAFGAALVDKLREPVTMLLDR
ncbi:MAG: dihydrolipoamide acetyltransferase family protein [Acidimicrobiia bacterium]